MTYDPPPVKKIPKKVGEYFRRLERKGLVRIVRTQAGADRYGQPIGSVIVLDAVPDGGRRKKHKRVEKVDNEPTAVRAKHPRRPKSAGAYSPNTPKTPKIPDTFDGPKALKAAGWSSDSHGQRAVHGDFGNIRTQSTYSGYEATLYDSRNQTELRWDGATQREAFDKAAHYALAKQKRITGTGAKEDEYGLRPRNAKKRPEGNLVDWWYGTRGIDWSYEDDPEYDPNDEDSRRALAHKDAEDMGFEWDRTRNNGGWETDVNIMEVANSVFNSHEAQYPGFMRNFMDGIGIDGTPGGRAIAANWVAPPFLDFEGKERHPVWITFSAKYAGAGYDGSDGGADIYENLERVAKAEGFTDNRPYGWHTTNYQELSENLGVGLWEASAISTLTHELGHSIARVVFSEVGLDRRGGRHYTNPDYIGNWYREDFVKLLDKYGFLGEDFEDDAETTNEDIKLMRQNRKLSGRREDLDFSQINREALKEHVSVYGSTNFHEMMAETWASYQLNEKPSAFVREMGAFMESVIAAQIEYSEPVAEAAKESAS